MNEEVDLAPFLRKTVEDGIHADRIRHVAGQDELRTDGFGEGENAFLQRFPLIGESEFGALFGTGLGDAPGD